MRIYDSIMLIKKAFETADHTAVHETASKKEILVLLAFTNEGSACVRMNGYSTPNLSYAARYPAGLSCLSNRMHIHG
jgi:hypothetical protein